MDPSPDPTITLTDEGEWWVAKDTETGVASQGRTREDALDNLDEAVQLHKGEIGESINTKAEEHAVLRDLGLVPDKIEAAREENDELPECLR